MRVFTRGGYAVCWKMVLDPVTIRISLGILQWAIALHHADLEGGVPLETEHLPATLRQSAGRTRGAVDLEVQGLRHLQGPSSASSTSSTSSISLVNFLPCFPFDVRISLGKFSCLSSRVG